MGFRNTYRSGIYNINYHSPRIFYKLIPHFVFLFVIFTGIRCGTDFFVTPMRSSGSRVDIAQKPNKSGQSLDQRWKLFFVIFTKLIPRRLFFCIANILVLVVLNSPRIFSRTF